MKSFKPVDLKKVKTYTIKQSKRRAAREGQGLPFHPGGNFETFIKSLPNFLAAKDLKEIILLITKARSKRKIILWGMGAHVIKVGLSRVIIDLMQNGFVTCLALNGAGVIHDVEMAMIGKTSEDVAAELDSGNFGMSEQIASFINKAVEQGVSMGQGFGESVGKALANANSPYKNESLLVAATQLNIPITVHIGIGTDIIHMHPTCNGGAMGKASHRDFRLLSDVVGHLKNGLYINVGSAVVLPEVFLKALNVARNLGFEVSNFSTINMDFIQHYRTMTNVTQRPVAKGGKGFTLIGHHEIMLPLLAAAIKEEMNKKNAKKNKNRY
jgi:deoxyhypusine synthase